jgi:hypothetical protein
MLRLALLILIFYLAFRFFLWLLRVVVLPFLQPPQPPQPPPEKKKSIIDPATIRDAKFSDLPSNTPDEADKKESDS